MSDPNNTASAPPTLTVVENGSWDNFDELVKMGLGDDSPALRARRELGGLVANQFVASAESLRLSERRVAYHDFGDRYLGQVEQRLDAVARRITVVLSHYLMDIIPRGDSSATIAWKGGHRAGSERAIRPGGWLPTTSLDIVAGELYFYGAINQGKETELRIPVRGSYVNKPLPFRVELSPKPIRPTPPATPPQPSRPPFGGRAA